MSQTLTEKKPARRPKRSFTRAQVELSLTALVANNGNTEKTSRDLADQGFEIDAKTLWRWKNKQYTEDYERLREQYGPQLRQATIDVYEQTVQDSLKAASILGQRIISEAKDIPIRDAPGAYRNLVVAGATASDKGLILRGEPTEIRAQPKASELIRALQAKNIEIEVIDAEVVSEENVERDSA